MTQSVLQGRQVFTTLKAAEDAGYEKYDEFPGGLYVRKQTAHGLWGMALVIYPVDT